MRLISKVLFAIHPWDPAMFGAGAGLVAVAASHIPARRAAKADPIVAMRYE